MKKGLILFTLMVACFVTFSQHSLARQWNEVLLNSIRNDFARPTVHARNLFHISAAMYDSWAAYDDEVQTYFLGNSVHGFECEFDGFNSTKSIEDSRKETLSYAVYRLIRHRFFESPGAANIYNSADSMMNLLGYTIQFQSTNYKTGSPAALGNYLAECIINYGLTDGSNEEGLYENLAYESVNDPLVMDSEGNPTLTDPNRWQPLTLETFIDQAGNEIPGSTPDFLSPEWGAVKPFSLNEEDVTIYTRDGFDYLVYHDPGDPPYFGSETDEFYKWGFALVSAWSSHLDPSDGVMIDISPKSIGNILEYPEVLEDYPNFYDFENGGDPSTGRNMNPITGTAYEEQLVPRGDYSRVLAEFWADGPDSETPPGHWFTLLNYVSDHPETVKKFEGEGDILSDLEWDVKSYFLLGGAMHDVAISSWGIKGWYDYIRPVSALRYMIDQGQSSDEQQNNYSPNGIPLYDGLIETVLEDDPLAGIENENVGKVKIKAWRGPDFVDDPDIDVAGVDWILGENWWPYQRPSFVTPPFAGYISGHSTYSRAAATVLTLLTGSEYFPGGLGEFVAKQNKFLVFEDGPSVDVKLQWATYSDAADQCSLSRIWGGIHPPADDLPGRVIGSVIGQDVFEFASNIFEGIISGTRQEVNIQVFPNPTLDEVNIRFDKELLFTATFTDLKGNVVKENEYHAQEYSLDTEGIVPGIYILNIATSEFTKKLRVVKQ